MRNPIVFACAFALLLPACEEGYPSVTFGLEFNVREVNAPLEETAAICVSPGAGDGSRTASSINHWEIGEPPPHLFLEADPDGYENVYRVRVYTASERERDGIWWVPSEILAERVYDDEFGEGVGLDSFTVDFEGQQYIVEAQGLPPDGTCF